MTKCLNYGRLTFSDFNDGRFLNRRQLGNRLTLANRFNLRFGDRLCLRENGFDYWLNLGNRNFFCMCEHWLDHGLCFWNRDFRRLSDGWFRHFFNAR